MNPSTKETKTGPTRRTRHALAEVALLGIGVVGIAVVGIAMLGLAAPVRAGCTSCPLAVGTSATKQHLSSLNFPTAAECIPADSGPIIDNGFAWVEFNNTGELVVNTRFEQAWSSKTTAGFLCFLDSGNLIIKEPNGMISWSTNTASSSSSPSGEELILDSHCYLQVLDAYDNVLWRSDFGGCVPATATKGQLAAKYDPTVTACHVAGAGTIIDNGNARLEFQGDGNLVVYTANGCSWSSKTQNKGNKFCFQGSDGHLLIYNDDGKMIWEAKGSTNNGETLSFTSDNQLQVFSSTWHWQSGHGGC